MELKTGELYRGMLLEAEDNWNSQLKDITVTGRVRSLISPTCIPPARFSHVSPNAGRACLSA